MNEKNPMTLQGSAHRVPRNIKALAGVDSRESSASTPKYQSETLAVRTLAQRFGLTIHHARVVSELAGIGGNA